ncbi:MAG: GldG family protein [Oscillospiraceae bacterium]|nr:GldG family protein [Oscillospiraceae bacterium]
MSKNQDEKELMQAESEQEEAAEALNDTEEQEEETAEKDVKKAEKKESGQKDSGKKPEKKKSKRTPQEEADRALNKVKRRKKLKYGTLSIVITLIFIAIIVTVNVICNVLDKRYNWNIDLTSSGLYEMDQQTKDYLHQLNSDIKITVLANESLFLENNQLKVVSETLNRFRTESNDHISVEYVDTTKNPEAVTKYTKNYAGQLSQGDVVVSSGDLVRVLKLNGEIINVEQKLDYSQGGYVYSYSFIGEQSLLSAITGVTDLNPVTVAVLDHLNGNMMFSADDQYGFVGMLDLLDKNNYTVEHIDLATDELSPDKYDYAILCAPYADLTDAQIQKLTDFLNNNGKYNKNLIYIASPYQRNLPNLTEFLEIWGIAVDRTRLLENNSSTAQLVPVMISNGMSLAQDVPVVTATDDDLNANYVAKLPIVAPACCPIMTLYETNAGRTTKALLTTSDSCITAAITQDGQGNETPAKYNVAVLATTSFTENSETNTSRIIAFGSPFFLNTTVTNNADTYGNADYFVSMMNKLTGKENIITIAEKNLNPTMISITDAQQKRLRNITVFIIPLTVAVIGLLVYLRRKNK